MNTSSQYPAQTPGAQGVGRTSYNDLYAEALPNEVPLSGFRYMKL